VDKRTGTQKNTDITLVSKVKFSSILGHHAN